MTTTKLRKALDNLSHLSIIEDYAEGELSLKEIAEKHSTTEKNVGLVTNRFWKKLTNMRESRCLLASESAPEVKRSLDQLQNTELINNSFLRLLSSNDTALLTEPESTYAWIYVHTGDAREAIVTAKLDIGLFKEKKKNTRFSYDKSVIIRSHYLNSKPNVASYIKELREKRYIDADIGKARVQTELLDQLEYMKASGDPKHKKDILRCIELLGKTVGAFTERIEVTEVSADAALDQLIEMAKEAEVREVSEESVTSIST